MNTERPCDISLITEAVPVDELMEVIIESVDEFQSENLAQEVSQGSGRQPPVVSGRIFDMVLRGKTIMDVTKTLNAEGVAASRGGRWRITTIHKILENEAYTGTLVWGNNAKDGAQPVRVENAFPAIVTVQEFQRVKRLLKSRSPKTVHPRRASSPYLLSGLAKCALCDKTLTAAEAKSGKYTYYVCQSILKTGSGACDTPRLNAKSFEETIILNIRENVLTESNVRGLVRSPATPYGYKICVQHWA